MTTIVHTTECLSPWEKVKLARHAERPHTRDFIQRLCSSFFELRGDRSFADDQALIGGIGLTRCGPIMVLGHQKGRNTKENIHHNFGMPHPEGYRKAQRLMQHAAKFGMPLVCLLDTPGAQPSMQAEERGQAQAIAQNLLTMVELTVPIVAVVTGEGSSGGALAIGIADRLLMLEHAIYAVASPEASASILWHDAAQAREAASAMRITAQDLAQFNIIDEIIPEPVGGAHCAPEIAINVTVEAVLRHLQALQSQSMQQLLRDRARRYRAIGQFYESSEYTEPMRSFQPCAVV